MNLQTYLSKLLRGIHLGPVLPHVFLKCSKKNIQNNVNERYNVSVPLRGSKSITIQWTRPTTTLFMRPHSFDLSGDILPFNSDTLEGHWEGGGWGHWRGLSLNCISKQLAHKLSTRRICKDYPPAFLTPKNQAKEQIWNYPRFLFFFGISFSSSNRQKTGWPGVSTFFETQQIERTRERRAARQRRTPGGGRKLALIPH